ncbi:hypothetical protein EG328_001594 [Venturia inaequalis]|uniref:Uncharacterized protein n=2 Tax=Venturia inaequalis TaxID=5025 RepID=A0A8H3VEV3_VENIN|nr:hypothetical protein EG328_001594 [Venturia inaequalis]
MLYRSQARTPGRVSQRRRKKTSLVLNVSKADVLGAVHDSPAACIGAGRCAMPPVTTDYPLYYRIALMKFDDFTVLVFSGSRHYKIDRLENAPQTPADTISRPAAAQLNGLIGTKLSWKKKRQSKSHALQCRLGSNSFTWLAVWAVDTRSSIDDPNTLFFKELNLARGSPGPPSLDIQGRGDSRYSPQPTCVPWASPSLRQNTIAEVLSNFRCISTAGKLHDFMQCYTPMRGRSKLSVLSGLNKRKPQFQLPPASLRSFAGGSQKDSHPRTSTQSTTTTSSKKPSTKRKQAAAKQTWDEEAGQCDSDEDLPEESPAPKRRRGENCVLKKDGLPCIFHVLDRVRYMYGNWRNCDPKESTYSNPTDLMRHLSRRHGIQNDKVHLWREGSSISLCKNCWNQYTERNGHWNNGKPICNKPTHRISKMEKWWAAYEMFCGPRTAAAAEYLESLVSEEHRQMSRQLGHDARQGANHAIIQVNNVISSPTTGAPGPSHWQSHHETSSTPFGHAAQGSFSHHVFHPSIQPSFSSTTEDSSSQSHDQTNSIGLPPQPNAQYTHEPQPEYPFQSFQNNNGDIYPSAQWHPQWPQNTAFLPSPLHQNSNADFLNPWTRLHEVEEENRRLKEQNKHLQNKSLKDQQPTTPVPILPPARSNTESSTASFLNGIAERDTPNPGTLEQFNSDLSAELIITEEEEPAQHFLQVVHYLPNLELGVPRALQGMPSVDSGYGTNTTDGCVDPRDTVFSPTDTTLTFSHT